MNYLLFVIIAIAGYLFGSVSFAVVIGKLMYNTDVREQGSKNAGATNVLRTLGKKAAALVTLGDVLKGVIAFIVGSWLGSFAGDRELAAVICGFSAVLGHNYPVFFKFKGGKGVLTSLALTIMLDWRAAIIGLVVFAIVVIITRYVSLGSLLGTVADAATICILHSDKPIFYITAILAAALIFVKHRANIKRLLNKTESKIF